MALFDDTDERLIQGLKNGDKEVYSHIYLSYYNRLCRYVYTLSDSAKPSEDIVQDTMMEIWAKRETLQIHTSLNAYLYRAVHNRFMNRCRDQKRQASAMDELFIQTAMEIENPEQTVQDGRLQVLQQIVDGLPKKCREIFVLHKFENYKYKEIAAMRNISERTVESHIRQALITIREEVVRLKLERILPLILLYLY